MYYPIVGSDIFVCLAIFLVLAILAISKTLQCYIQFATLLHITFVPPLCVSLLPSIEQLNCF